MPTFHFKKAPSSLISSLCLAILLSITSVTVSAQNMDMMTDPTVSDFLSVYSTAADKIDQLANEFPTEKYDWRPAEGIRSVREVLQHVTSASYYFGSMIGIKTPDGVNPQAMGQSDMSKDEAISALEKAITTIKNGLPGISEEALNEEIDFFGGKATKRQVMLTLGDHTSEHLGQLIAYARMNGVVPPWSQ